MRLKYKPLILLFILPFLNSCINNADFDQVDVDAEPILNFPLVFFELDQLDFLDDTGTVELSAVADITELDVFQSSLVRNNLGRVDLIFEIENMFGRGFQVEVDFLDDADNVTYSFNNISVAAGLNFVEIREGIVVNQNPAIFNTTKMRVIVNLVPSSLTLDPDEEKKLEFRSIGIFYLFF